MARIRNYLNQKASLIIQSFYNRFIVWVAERGGRRAGGCGVIYHELIHLGTLNCHLWTFSFSKSRRNVIREIHLSSVERARGEVATSDWISFCNWLSISCLAVRGTSCPTYRCSARPCAISRGWSLDKISCKCFPCKLQLSNRLQKNSMFYILGKYYALCPKLR